MSHTTTIATAIDTHAVIRFEYLKKKETTPSTREGLPLKIEQNAKGELKVFLHENSTGDNKYFLIDCIQKLELTGEAVAAEPEYEPAPF